MSTASTIALVGCGMFGNQHARAAMHLTDSALVAVVDPDRERADALARITGASVASFDEIVADDHIDAVILATPTDTHFELAAELIAAGKHLLVEKPITLSMTELETLIQASEQNDSRLYVGQSVRFEPTVRALWTSLRSGEYGEPVLFNWVSNSSRPWPAGWQAWQADPQRSGGMPFHLGIHGIDLAVWLFDSPPQRVYAQGADIAAPASGIYDYHHISVRFENDANALIEYHAGLPGRLTRHQEFCLYGTAGQAGWKLQDDGLLLDADGGRPYSSEAATSLQRQIAHFMACCRGEQTPLVTHQQIRYGLAIAIAARMSLESSQAVDVAGILKGA